jgi:2-polyprenyl-3-methyl-5-hydroxy-6-metoxy-1,4-benzoquinol methylase
LPEEVTMGHLNEQDERVAQHYDSISDFESARLATQFPVEFAITARYLNRWVADGATVADVGAGGGHYAELLARRGCRVHLVDVSQGLLDAAQERLQDAGLQGQVVGISRLSATELRDLPAGGFDAVLLLGPLYHLATLEQRRAAVREAAKLLKWQGVLFAAGINRLTYLRDLYRESPAQVLSRAAFHKEHLRDGNLTSAQAPPIGYAHLTTVDEFRDLFADDFEELALLGVESFTGPWQQALASLTPAEAEAWLDLVERTGGTAEGRGMSDHFLFVGAKAEDARPAI